MNKITRQTMIDHCKREVSRGSIYVWGAQGQRGSKITKAWIRRMETSTTNANRAITTWEARKKSYDKSTIGAYDCSGLIAACFNDNSNPGWDSTADGLYRSCVKISKSQLQPGDFVFEWSSASSKSNHVGVYIGDGYVIEARGRDYGVVKTALNARNWVRFGRPDFCYRDSRYTGNTSATTSKPVSAPKPANTSALPTGIYYYRCQTACPVSLRTAASATAKIVKSLPTNTSLRYRGKEGFYAMVSINNGSGVRGYIRREEIKPNFLPASDGVKAIQKAVGVTADGLYGSATANAVYAFQKSVGLTADGIYGPNTRAALLKK